MKSFAPNLKFLIFAVFIFIYIAFRLWHLTDSCLRFDEIFSVHAAEHSWQSLSWFVAQDLIHPPLFYALLKIWIFTGGESLLWLRLFPVLFSIIALLPFFLLCREMKLDFSAIFFALIFFTFNGTLIKYAQEVRMYSVLQCFALFSIWLFVRLVNDKKSFAALLIINNLLVYTHYFGWLILASELIAVLFLQRTKLKQIFIICSITLVSFLPWLYLIRQAAKLNADYSQNLGWAARPDLPTLLQFIFDLAEPVYFQQSNAAAGANLFITLPLILLAVVIFFLGIVGWKNTSDKELQRNFRILCFFILVPVFAAFAASWVLPVSIWGTRHLLIIFVPLALLLGILFANTKIIPPLQTVFLSLILVLSGAALIIQARNETPKFSWCAWENLADDLKATEKSSAEPLKIYTFEDLIAYHLWFATRRNPHIRLTLIRNYPAMSGDPAYFLPRDFNEVTMTDGKIPDADNFRLAFTDTEWNAERFVLQDLRAHGYQIGEPQIAEIEGLKAILVKVTK